MTACIILFLGTVKLGIHYNTGEKIAVKCINKEKLSESVLTKVCLNTQFLKNWASLLPRLSVKLKNRLSVRWFVYLSVCVSVNVSV